MTKFSTDHQDLSIQRGINGLFTPWIGVFFSGHLVFIGVITASNRGTKGGIKMHQAQQHIPLPLSPKRPAGHPLLGFPSPASPTAPLPGWRTPSFRCGAASQCAGASSRALAHAHCCGGGAAMFQSRSPRQPRRVVALLPLGLPGLWDAADIVAASALARAVFLRNGFRWWPRGSVGSLPPAGLESGESCRAQCT